MLAGSPRHRRFLERREQPALEVRQARQDSRVGLVGRHAERRLVGSAGVVVGRISGRGERGCRLQGSGRQQLRGRRERQQHGQAKREAAA